MKYLKFENEHADIPVNISYAGSTPCIVAVCRCKKDAKMKQRKKINHAVKSLFALLVAGLLAAGVGFTASSYAAESGIHMQGVIGPSDVRARKVQGVIGPSDVRARKVYGVIGPSDGQST